MEPIPGRAWAGIVLLDWPWGDRYDVFARTTDAPQKEANRGATVPWGTRPPEKETRMAQRQQYRIESVDDQGNWSADVVGMEHDNQFATKADAQAAIAFLRTLGEEWATAAYRIRPIRRDQ